MAGQSSTLKQFQEYVWESLPPHRLRAGREVVDDLVALAIQEWPADVLSQAEPGSEEEKAALHGLLVSMKRQAELLYGQVKFAGLWLIALQILLPIIINKILEWWNGRKDNRRRLLMWRRKWRTDDGET